MNGSTVVSAMATVTPTSTFVSSDGVSPSRLKPVAAVQR